MYLHVGLKALFDGLSSKLPIEHNRCKLALLPHKPYLELIRVSIGSGTLN